MADMIRFTSERGEVEPRVDAAQHIAVARVGGVGVEDALTVTNEYMAAALLAALIAHGSSAAPRISSRHAP